MKKNCILITGPTAVGKTALAIQVAQYFSTEIISCDSRQCFKELNIGVAKPTDAELALVYHHFINSHSIQQPVSAAVFEQYALEKINTIFAAYDIAVMVGGTGLYVKAFCEGMDEVPGIDPAIRQTIITNYNNNGIEWLKEQVKNQDKAYYSIGEILNPQRLMRALEVVQSTGKSLLAFHTNQKKKRDFKIIKIGLEIARPQLIERINKRVDDMMQDGLLEEVSSLLPFKSLNALQTVGYQEIFAHLQEKISLTEAIEQIKINTRQYAKRQITWFKKDEAVQWCSPDFEDVIAKVKKQLQ
jgi:tRNA dimethylallyltransferase